MPLQFTLSEVEGPLRHYLSLLLFLCSLAFLTLSQIKSPPATTAPPNNATSPKKTEPAELVAIPNNKLPPPNATGHNTDTLDCISLLISLACKRISS